MIKSNMRKQIQLKKEWRKTAENLNRLPEDQRIRIVIHIKGKYDRGLIDSMRDRLDALAAGYGCDEQLISWLDQYLGISF
jgi:hypothetical protein